MSTIFPASIRLQKWMNQTSNVTWAMTEQDRQISAIFAEQRSRLRNFIRRRVPDPRDAEDILQDAFYKLVEANRLLMPIDHVTSWLFRVARNRITDLFRKKKQETFSNASVADEDGELLQIEDLLPSPDAGPEALYARNALLHELELALDELTSAPDLSLPPLARLALSDGHRQAENGRGLASGRLSPVLDLEGSAPPPRSAHHFA